MATDAQTLLNEARCYECYASNPYTLNLLKLALLQQIAAAGSGPDVDYFNLVGTAYIGGDQTGNARGANAVDVQAARTLVTQVASGANSTAIGRKNIASGIGTFAAGVENTASGNYCVAIGSLTQALLGGATAVGTSTTATTFGASAFGYHCEATGNFSMAFGNEAHATAQAAFAGGITCFATAIACTAFGYHSVSRITQTTNICGPQIIRKDNGETLTKAFESFCGVNTVFMWPEEDLKSVTDYTITLPAGCHFFPDECGVIVTSATLVTVQPTVRFGNTGTPAKFLAAAITTTAAAQFDRHRFQTLLSAAGEVTLSAGVTIAVTATTMLGRFYMKGLLVEDE